MEMTPKRWDDTSAYLRDVFGAQDEQLRTLMPRAVAAGLPDIAVSPDVGRLLAILVSMAGEGRGARNAIELGTLAGYSGIWIARALAPPPNGRLFTIEPEVRHADFAQREFERAGVADRVTIIRRPGLEALAVLARELRPGSVDVVFLDAIKTEYSDYFRATRRLIAPGGLLIADNTLGSGGWWIDNQPGTSPERDAIDRFNRTVAIDDVFDAVCLPIRQGVLVARKKW